MTSDNQFILPEYIAQRFKIILIDSSSDEDSIKCLYVDEIDPKQLEDMHFLINKRVILDRKISESEYLIHFKNIYKSSLKSKNKLIPDIEAPLISKDISNQKNSESNVSDNITAEEFVKTLPLELIEKEIKRRYLTMNLSGELVYSGSEVSFKIDKMFWPEGKYKILVQCLGEVN